MENTFVIHLNKLKLLKGFIMIVLSQVAFVVNSLFESVLFSLILNLNRSKFGSKIEGTIL